MEACKMNGKKFVVETEQLTPEGKHNVRDWKASGVLFFFKKKSGKEEKGTQQAGVNQSKRPS